MLLNPFKRKKSSSINAPKEEVNWRDALAPAESHPKKFRVRGVRAHTAAILFVSIALAFGTAGETASYFSNIQLSLGNFFVADPLYFSVTPESQTIAVGQNDALFVPVMATGEKSEPVQYEINTQMTGGDAVLCDSIEAMTTEPFPYWGPLLSLATATTTETGPFALTFSAAGNIDPGASCTVDLIYKGWEVGSVEGAGYSDTHRVSLTFVYEPPVAAVPDSTDAAPQDADASSTDAIITPPLTDSATTTEDTPDTSDASTTPPAQTQ